MTVIWEVGLEVGQGIGVGIEGGQGVPESVREGALIAEASGIGRVSVRVWIKAINALIVEGLGIRPEIVLAERVIGIEVGQEAGVEA